MSGNRPTEEDFTYLSDLLVVRDSDAVCRWIDEHVNDAESAFDVLFVIASAAGELAPLALTKDAHLGPDDMWALHTGPKTTKAQKRAGQLVAVALNRDDDTLEALVGSFLPRKKEELQLYVQVLTEILLFYRDALVALAESKDGDQA